MHQEWLLKRNCSLSPRQVARFYGVLCAFTLSIGLAFAVNGILFVLVFSVVEAGVVVAAVLHYARHATDQERVALKDGSLLIERIEAGKSDKFELDAYFTRIVVPTKRRTLIQLESRGVKVEIGSFVSEKIRQQVAHEMRRELRVASILPQPRG